jgi:hypothetical protein
MNEQSGLSGSEEWHGRKPSQGARSTITVATLAVILALLAYLLAERGLGLQTQSSGMLLGILSGLLTSGITAGAGWFLYDYFLPYYRHKHFRPKIGGKWFGYYPETLSESVVRMTEYVYMRQTADRVSGVITSRGYFDPKGVSKSEGNRVYDFVGEIFLDCVVLTWVSHEQDRDVAGAIVLNRVTDGLWHGIQVTGKSWVPYTMSSQFITEKEWLGLFCDSVLPSVPENQQPAEPKPQDPHDLLEREGENDNADDD